MPWPCGDSQLRVSGWAADRDDALPVRVQIVVDDQIVATLTADEFRSDVGRLDPAIGASHGFDAVITLTSSITPRRICVNAIDDGVDPRRARLSRAGDCPAIARARCRSLACSLFLLRFVAFVVAGCAAEFEFVDDGVSGLFVVGVVVVAQQVGGSAVDAGAVAFVDDSFLSCRGVSLAARRVDGSPLGVVDQRPDERLREEPGDGAVGDGGAVVEGAAVTADVETTSVTTVAPPPVMQRRGGRRLVVGPATATWSRCVSWWSPAGACWPRSVRATCASTVPVRIAATRVGSETSRRPCRRRRGAISASSPPAGALSRSSSLSWSLRHRASSTAQLGGRVPLGDGAQLVLIVGVGDPGQRPDLAVGQPPIGEAASDLVDRRQGVADTQPLAHGAQLDIGAVRDPMRATRRVVEGPLTGEVEVDQQRDERRHIQRQPPRPIDHRRPQRRRSTRVKTTLQSTMTTPTTAPPIGGIGLFRSGHHAGSQALALAA